MTDPDGCWNAIGCLVILGALAVLGIGLYVSFIVGNWALGQITG